MVPKQNKQKNPKWQFYLVTVLLVHTSKHAFIIRISFIQGSLFLLQGDMQNDPLISGKTYWCRFVCLSAI